jgi:signal peptidase I
VTVTTLPSAATARSRFSSVADGWLTLMAAVSLAALALVLMLGVSALLPRMFGWTPAVVVSGSMMPALRPGDVVYYQPATAEGLRPGRIILTDDPNRRGQLLSHRIAEIGPDGTVTTKGDANAAADSQRLATSAVHGQARLVIPYVGLPTLISQPAQRTRSIATLAIIVLACAWPWLRQSPPVPTSRPRRYRPRHVAPHLHP